MIALRDSRIRPDRRASCEMQLGRQDDVLPAAVLLQRSPDDLLRATKPVDVGGVPEGDAELDGLLEERSGVVISQGPLAEST